MSETTPEADPRKLAEEARDRVRFEEELRRFVRQAAVEEMPPDLKQKLAELRTSLF